MNSQNKKTGLKRCNEIRDASELSKEELDDLKNIKQDTSKLDNDQMNKNSNIGNDNNRDISKDKISSV